MEKEREIISLTSEDFEDIIDETHCNYTIIDEFYLNHSSIGFLCVRNIDGKFFSGSYERDSLYRILIEDTNLTEVFSREIITTKHE